MASLIARAVGGQRSARLLAIITSRPSAFHHHHAVSSCTMFAKHSNSSFLADGFKRTLVSPRHQTVLLDQIRTINIAGEESLELAKRKGKWRKQRRQETNSGGPPKRRTIFAYMFVLLPIATFCLGTWQIYRLQWKLDLIEKLENMVKSTPAEFPEDLGGLQEQEYLKVRLTGYFDTSAEPAFIFPRPMLKESAKQEQSGGGLFSASKAGNIGAQMIVPFVVTESRLLDAYSQLLIESGREDLLTDKKQFRILVNVGWVPREVMDKVNKYRDGPKSTNDDAPAQEFELVGVIRKNEKREPFAQKNSSTKEYFSRRDIIKLASELDTTPIYLDAQPSYPISLARYPETITPVGAQTRVNLRNEHLSYIVTWYSLSVIFSYLWYKKIFKPRL